MLKGKYSRRFNVAQAMDYKGTDSPLWIDIVKHSAPLVKEEWWVIGNGEKVNALNDKWLDENTKVADFITDIPDQFQNLTVSDLTTSCGQ